MMIDDILRLPASATTYAFGKSLGETYPGQYVLESAFTQFDLLGHANAGLSAIVEDPGYQQWLTQWQDAIVRFPLITSFAVKFHDRALRVAVLTYDSQQPPRLFVVAESRAIAEGYFESVHVWTNELREQILVFEGGSWQKDEQLFEDIQNATFANLVLAGDLGAEIKRDVDDFLASRELYTRYRIPWKRGMLFIGPPGNGKTHAVKALLNSVRFNCLYVKSFDLPGGMFPQAGVSMVFGRARQSAPCLVVLEDLDSLVGPHNRSFFLNELDGFASNEGVIVLATTNHPERLDRAILERPSRFDRKYLFALPQYPERTAYLRYWNTTLEPSLQIGAELIDELANATDAFSFASLRELFLSSLMRWISDEEKRPFASIVPEQVAVLREQIAASPEDAEEVHQPNGASFPPHMMRAMVSGGMLFGGRPPF